MLTVLRCYAKILFKKFEESRLIIEELLNVILNIICLITPRLKRQMQNTVCVLLKGVVVEI